MNKTFIFFVLFLLTACASINNQQGVQPLEKNDALMDEEGATTEEITYQEGEITDIADRNPNFLDLNTENEAHNNRGAYQNKLREVVASSEVFEPGMIYMNGYRAVVNVTPKRKFSEDKLREHKEDLERKLQDVVPRFKIDVRVNTDNE